jgi:hypothetical protein
MGLGLLARNFLEKSEKIHRKLSQESQSPVRDTIVGPLEYKGDTLITWPRRFSGYL